MTDQQWRGVLRAAMRDQRAERFAVVVRMARRPVGWVLGGRPLDAVTELPADYHYEPNGPYLDLGGEGG